MPIFCQFLGACLSNGWLSDTGRPSHPVHGRGRIDRLGSPICDVSDVCLPSAREAPTVIVFRWVQGCSWTGDASRSRCLLLGFPLTRKAGLLTRSSIVVCLYRIAIPDGEVSGARKCGHSSGKNLKGCQTWEHKLSFYGKSIFWGLRKMRDKSKYCSAKNSKDCGMRVSLSWNDSSHWSTQNKSTLRMLHGKGDGKKSLYCTDTANNMKMWRGGLGLFYFILSTICYTVLVRSPWEEGWVKAPDQECHATATAYTTSVLENLLVYSLSPIFSLKGFPWPFSWTMYSDIRETSGDTQGLALDSTITD